MFKKQHLISAFKLCFLFSAAFCIGTMTAHLQKQQSLKAIPTAADGNWGLSFPEEGKTPTGNATSGELSKYNAFYAGNPDKKIIYLTFDVVGNFLKENPDLVKRMQQEGHIVGNHTYTHPDMSKISTKEAFDKELGELSTLYQKTTGEEMTKFYRPPQGKYSEANLQMAKEMGYHTFFWSLAYVDWYQDQQPTREEAFEKLLGRIHPGAIVLLHSTSSTNASILDELLTKWEEMGYTFGSLNDLIQTT